MERLTPHRANPLASRVPAADRSRSANRFRSAMLAGLCAALLAAATPWRPAAAQRDPVLFELDGRAYRIGDLRPKLRRLVAELEAEHYRERRDLLDQLVFDAFLQAESERTGRPRVELARELLLVDEPTEDDARRFYEANKDRIGQDFDAVENRILVSLRVARLREKKSLVVARLAERGALRTDLTPPRPPPVDIDTAGRPALGPVDAPFELVEFIDFSCPLCQRAARTIHGIMDEFPGRIRWVVMDYPVGRDGVAARIHEAGHCLADQGQGQELFWRYHDEVFARQAELEPDDGPALAAELGADMEAFESCYASEAPRRQVERALQIGRELKVRRTPTLYVNGRPFASSDLEKDLRQMLEHDAAAAGAEDER